MRALVTLIASFLFGLSTAAAQVATAGSIDDIARSYVILIFGERELNPDSISVYAPRPDEEAVAKNAKRDAAAIATEARHLIARLDDLPIPAEKLAAMRVRSLRARLVALQTRAEAAGGAKWPIAEQVFRYYGFKADFRPLSEYDAAIEQLDRAMSGPGTLSERIAAMRKAARVPPEKVEAVFNAALGECRKRTERFLQLPPNSIELSFTDDPMAPAEQQYVGGGKSVVRYSKAFPGDVDWILKSACHEVYPGHHTHFVLADEYLYKQRGWVEFAVDAIPGPVIPLAEAIGEYGVDLAFPLDERIAFERDVLFPLAGLTMNNPADWRAYLAARPTILGASSTVGRDFLEKRIDEDTAFRQFVRYRLQTPESARQLIKMLPVTGSFLIASDMGWYAVDRALRGKPREEQWRLLRRLATEPMLLDDIAALGRK